MPKSDTVKDTISKMEEEVKEIQHDIDELEKRKGRIRGKKILDDIRRGKNGNIVNM